MTSRLAYLLGEMRRQMNGAVVGGMRFYGAEYGLNYGVSLPTIRSIARTEVAQQGVDHRFARQLYKQEVRELRLAALWMADSTQVIEEIDFWTQGIINSEIAEEAAFALFHLIEGDWVDSLLRSESELLSYCAVMTIAKRGDASAYLSHVPALLSCERHILPKAIVILLEAALRSGVEPTEIEQILTTLPDSASGVGYIREEMSWRMMA